MRPSSHLKAGFGSIALDILSVNDDLDDAIPHLFADVVACQPNEVENGVHVPCVVLSKLLRKNSNLQHLVKEEEGGREEEGGEGGGGRGGRRREGKEEKGGEGGGGRGRRRREGNGGGGRGMEEEEGNGGGGKSHT